MRWFTRTTTLIVAFTIGVGISFVSFNKTRSCPAKSVRGLASYQRSEPEWPLTREIVSQALQTHSFSTKLPLDVDDQIVWRWLKEAIAAYPQTYLKLEPSNEDTYGVVLYPRTVLHSPNLEYYNEQLKTKGLPTLNANKQYIPINVYLNNIICPSWMGLIDVDEAKLVFFEGNGA
ncbi:MAG TPA: hypothetical protein VLA93_06605 [Pyrinomonadaceae bacterium]|nr:hypothetical protein [Pyrinomonadaceae bacterium]